MNTRISYVRNFFLIALACTLLSGCFEGKTLATGKTQTVEWFKEHNTERGEVLMECSNNPGELDHLPNCENAIAAELSMSGGEPTPIKW